MSTEIPRPSSAASTARPAVHRRRVPWRLLTVVFGVLAVLASWYVLTVDAIRNDFDEVIRLGADGIPLTGLNDEEGISFAGYCWKNTSVLPITILGVEPVPMPSDWQFSEMRLGTLAGGEDPVRETKPFVPQHLAPGEGGSCRDRVRGSPVRFTTSRGWKGERPDRIPNGVLHLGRQPDPRVPIGRWGLRTPERDWMF
jgi:hypothetical protein